MIDIENAVISRVSSTLKSVFSGITVKGEYEDSPKTFPAVSIYENDNSVYKKMSAGKIENASSVMYEVDVYSNTAGFRKEETQDIMHVIDGVMSELGFTRTMCSPISNLNNATIYRLHARYTGIVTQETYQDEYGMDAELYRVYTR